jgi:hypothetical protein
MTGELALKLGNLDYLSLLANDLKYFGLGGSNFTLALGESESSESI